MSVDLQDWIGRSQTGFDPVSPSHLARFKSALNYSASEGDVPDGFHWCLCLPDAYTKDLGPDGHPALGAFMPPLKFPRRMWAASDVEFLAQLTPDMKIQRRSEVKSITPKSGRSGDLVFVVLEHVNSSGGTDLIREQQTIVYRDHPTAASPLPPVDDAVDIGQWDWHETVLPNTPLLFRYSAITFNTHRIHYDQEYATQTELYPALVVHGPLTASLLLKLCADNLGQNKLSRFNYRAKSPLFAGQPLHLVGRKRDDKIELQARGGDGRLAMEATASLKNSI